MPLRLKQLELHGYKTFATKQEFTFTEGISAIVGPNGSGKCVSGDTLVALADGREMPIRVIVEDALEDSQHVEKLDDGHLIRENRDEIEVLSLNPASLRLEPRRVAAFVRRTAPSQLIRVHTRSGREITATPYHPLFTLDDGALRSVRADEIQTGLRLAVPRQLPAKHRHQFLPPRELLERFVESDGVFIPNSPEMQAWAGEVRQRLGSWAVWRRAAHVPAAQFVGFRNGQAVNAAVLTRLAEVAQSGPPMSGAIKASNTPLQFQMPAELTPELARWVGLLVAEGRSTDSNQVWFVDSDPAVVDEYVRLARRIFGVPVHQKNYKPNAVDVLIYSAPLQAFLKRVFDFPVRSASASKRVPALLFGAEAETQWAFLSGLFEGDAYICARPATAGKRAQSYIEYTTASEHLARGVITLLLQQGVFATLRKTYKAASNTTAKQLRRYYSVLIYGTEQLRCVASQLTFSGAKSQALAVLGAWPAASNPNHDLVPGATDLVKQAAHVAQLRLKPLRRQYPKLVAYVEQRCEASRPGLAEVVRAIQNLGQTPQAAAPLLDRLTVLAQSDVYWDEVISVEQVTPADPWVYDLSVADHHNFVAANIIVHNSNIVDSIRWVLGEQSFGLLRGKRTEDMIFAGSELRPRAGMAQATLVFDNSDGWLPIDFSEVSIARRAYRDGENEYLLNGQRVRLRDISELLAKCGMAERTYTIIGQGLIDTALSLKSDERRALFEEAAGIGVYRNKREDALRKLEATQRNLERVLDILAEIKPRLRSLERQAQRAHDFNQVKDDLHAVLKLWYGYHWHQAVAELDQAREAAAQTAAELAEMQGRQENYDQEVAGLRAHIAHVRQQLNAERQTAARLHAESEALARELAVADERQRSLAEQRDALLAELPPLEAQLAEQAERVAAAQSEVARLAAEAAEAEQQIGVAQAALAARENERAVLRRRESEIREQLAALDTRLSDQRARLAQLLERHDRLAAAQAEQQAALAERAEAEAKAQTALASATEALDAERQARAQAEAQAATSAEALRLAEAELAEARQHASAGQAEAERLRARHDVLEQARAQLAGFGAGARTLLSQQFATRGALAELISVPPQLEAAVTAALGANLEALVVNDYADAEAAVALLGGARGRAALLPLQSLRGRAPLVLPADLPGVVGLAAGLVSSDDWLRPAVDLLLGQVVVVRDHETARRLIGGEAGIDRLPIEALAVTLDGTVFAATGPVMAGRDAAPTMLEQARERRDLSAALDQQRQRVTEMEARRGAAAQAATARRVGLDNAQAALHHAQEAERQAGGRRDAAALESERVKHDVALRRQQMAALEAEAEQVTAATAATQAELTRMAAEREAIEASRQSASDSIAEFTVEDAAAALARWQTAGAVAARAVRDAQARAAELERARSAAAGLVHDRRQKAQRLEAEAGEVAAAAVAARDRHAQLAQQIEEAEARRGPLEAELAEQELEQARVESGDAEARSNLHAAERRNGEAQIEQARRNEELEGMRRRIEEDFGLVELDYGEAGSGPTPLPLYPVVERLARVESLPEGLEEQLNRKRGQLRRMGLINPDAEREHLEVKERHEFLTTQVADLESAQAQLREVIAEMDVLMERDFRKTFDAVAGEFRGTFTQLFGGGSARLVLTDPEHLSTTGVDIQARLPGRRAQSLAMLSGGERSLTACALIFALLRVSPTPFCVLDEVDAMLDEANVGRYRDMLLTLSDNTQFIIVTHNRNTVQVADTVYGITMGADSASQVMGLRLEGEKLKATNGADAEAVSTHLK